jgi:hypothetical protein
VALDDAVREFFMPAQECVSPGVVVGEVGPAGIKWPADINYAGWDKAAHSRLARAGQPRLMSAQPR